MGDVNQLAYLNRFVPSVSGPILEIGSKDYERKEYGKTATFRGFYPDNEYVGVDMEPGKDVDVVVDLTTGVAGLPQSHFALAICCSVLEHVSRPWVFAENLTSLMREGGLVYMSVPWVWRYHAYPDDYFRFSWRGVMQLFPQLKWQHIYYSTNMPNEFVAIRPENPGVDDTMAATVDTPKGKRKYLPYLMINMIGEKTGLAE